MKNISEKNDIVTEWNGGAIASFFYIFIYIIAMIHFYPLLNFVINFDKVFFSFILGLIGMSIAFRYFRIKKYGKGTVVYFISGLPSLVFREGIIIYIFLSIFVITTVWKKQK